MSNSLYSLSRLLLPVVVVVFDRQVRAFVVPSLQKSPALLSQRTGQPCNYRYYGLLRASTDTEEEQRTAEEIMEEADAALAAVGWAAPSDEAELTSDDPFVKQINDSILKDVGVELDELLNPAKVVNLERDLYNLRAELAQLTGNGDMEVAGLSTEEIDGGGGGENADDIRSKISKKETDLAMERRSVFRGWLKNVFLVQAILSFALSWVMVSNPAQLFGGFGWFYSNNMDTSIRVLGFWWWWLFVIPSLRSRRPKGAEKKALDLAFLATPLVSLVAPAATKETELIWFANLVAVAGSYAFAYLTNGDDDGSGDDDKSQPQWLKFIYKSLDFGSGRERGVRK